MNRIKGLRISVHEVDKLTMSTWQGRVMLKARKYNYEIVLCNQPHQRRNKYGSKKVPCYLHTSLFPGFITLFCMASVMKNTKKAIFNVLSNWSSQTLCFLIYQNCKMTNLDPHPWYMYVLPVLTDHCLSTFSHNNLVSASMTFVISRTTQYWP